MAIWPFCVVMKVRFLLGFLIEFSQKRPKPYTLKVGHWRQDCTPEVIQIIYNIAFCATSS